MIKKLLCILLSVVLVFSLAACAKDKTDNKDDVGKQFGDTIADVEDTTEDNEEDEAAVKELQKKFKVPHGKELVKRLLLSGEISALADTITELTGYKEDLIEEIKN